MDLTPYLDSLRRDLAAAAAPGGPEISHAAELLTGSLDASARLCLLQALADAAAEVTTQLPTATVEVRLRGRDPDLVVTDVVPDAQTTSLLTPSVTAEPAGDVARVTLRLPDSLKDEVERAAAAEGISVNSWLVRAVTAAVHNRPVIRSGHGPGRRITGFAQS